MRGDDSGTVHISRGTGNWHARYGQIKDYVTYQDELQRCRARQNYEQP